MRTWKLAALPALFVASALACGASTDPDRGAECHAGDRVQCGCGNQIRGLQSCVDGKFGPCACPPDASAGAPDAAGADAAEGDAATDATAPFDAGFGNFMGACASTADCPDGGTCFSFTAKGLRCTTACTSNEDCASPSPKCNPRMVCAIPD